MKLIDPISQIRVKESDERGDNHLKVSTAGRKNEFMSFDLLSVSGEGDVCEDLTVQ